MKKNRSPRGWNHRARHALRHSLRVRLVVMFLLLALATTVTFIGGMQKALSIGWRDAARPLLVDYVDRLAAEIGSPPSVEKARALTARLPVAVRISGPSVNWQSDDSPRHWRDSDRDSERESGRADAPLLARTTADGHRIELGLSLAAWSNQPRRIGWITLGVLLFLTGIAYVYVRRLLRPLDDIRAGAQRFGKGEFGDAIPIRRRDELGALAGDINTMAHDIQAMLDAKRALLLAISHELRSPLTRARLNTELLPETADMQMPRDALLRDLSEMRDLITDLLESERLGQGHAALHLEPTDLAALAREVVNDLPQPGAQQVRLFMEPGLPEMPLDRTRMRLLLRNLLDNALRHGADAAQPPELHLAREGGESGGVERTPRVTLTVRDHGPGVPDAALAHLAEPFFRPDASRERATGGVGLGLYLSRLVAEAHGGSWQVKNAQPGLVVSVTIPSAPKA